MSGEPAILARSRDLVVPVLRKAIDGLDPLLRAAAEYHFGWIERDGTPTDAPGGKAVRPALVLLGAEAAGAEAAVALPGAAAMELIHNFSLVHDDIMDGDRTRRHRPTVWDVYGVGDAIIVGDALHTLAFQLLAETSGATTPRALRKLAEATAAMIAGQAQDTTLDRSTESSLADCLEMERNKTAALLAGSVALGAIIGGGDDELVATLERYGTELGMAFQAVDDLLGIWGDPGVTGKPAGNDLREHKKSVPVALALATEGELAARIRTAFAGELDDDAIAGLAEALDAAGIRDEVKRRAADHLAAAVAALDRHDRLPAAVADQLAELARFVVDRDH